MAGAAVEVWPRDLGAVGRGPVQVPVCRDAGDAGMQGARMGKVGGIISGEATWAGGGKWLGWQWAGMGWWRSGLDSSGTHGGR